MENLTGKTAIVTGANTGIGLITARELAAAGARVYFGCRNVEKATRAMAEVRSEVPNADLKLLQMDLSSFESTRRAAEEFLATGDSLDLLINNAGVVSGAGKEAEGFQFTFLVNHLSPFLFTMLLLERVVDSAPARIVNVASQAHYRTKEVDFESLKGATKTVVGMEEYEVSKLANVLFTAELDKRLKDVDVSTYSLHPGVVATDIWRRVPWPFDKLAHLFMISPEEGAQTTLHCATDPDAFDQSGLYWDQCEPKKPSSLARDADLAEELWERSIEWTGAPDWPRR